MATRYPHPRAEALCSGFQRPLCRMVTALPLTEPPYDSRSCADGLVGAQPSQGEAEWKGLQALLFGAATHPAIPQARVHAAPGGWEMG